MSHHLLIAGTGRAGTSFLVRLLHELGLDTHLRRPEGEQVWFKEANAGFEDGLIGGEGSPYVVKSPWLFEWIDQVLAGPHVIDGVILPIRDLADAAASRSILEYQQMHRSQRSLAAHDSTWENRGGARGGAVYSLHPLDQGRILATGFFKLVQRLTEADVPMHFVAFPRLVDDGAYLYDRLRPVLPENVTREMFLAAHGRLADPDQVRVRAVPVETPEQAENAALKRELTRVRDEAEELRKALKAAKSAPAKREAASAATGHLGRILGAIRRRAARLAGSSSR